MLRGALFSGYVLGPMVALAVGPAEGSVGIAVAITAAGMLAAFVVRLGAIGVVADQETQTLVARNLMRTYRWPAAASPIVRVVAISKGFLTLALDDGRRRRPVRLHGAILATTTERLRLVEQLRTVVQVDDQYLDAYLRTERVTQ